VIPQPARYQAIRALEHVEDWYRTTGPVVRLEYGPGKRGKFSGVGRVWITGGTEGDRHRRGIRVPADYTPEEFTTLLADYLRWRLTARIGTPDGVVIPPGA
jgi:hypothetical protein